MKTAHRLMLVLGIAALVVCSWIAPLDAPAAERVDAGLKRALVSFATARVLNGAISVIQGTQIAIQPAGIGATLTPGQVLAPINELVKHFADLMLIASIAFGIQKALISISGYWVISLVLTATALGWAAFYVRQGHPPPWLSKVLVILLMVRFAIPVVTLGSDAVSQRFLATDYAASQKAIDVASSQTTKLGTAEAVTPDPPGTLDKLKELIPKVPDFKARFAEMRQAAELESEHMIKLMVVFTLQTLVMPLLLLWGLYAAARAIFERPLQLTNRDLMRIAKQFEKA